MRYKLKYVDVVKPQARHFAEEWKAKIEAETGKPHKITKLRTYQDELIMDIEEVK